MAENHYISTNGGRYIEMRDNSSYIENFSMSQNVIDSALEIQKLLENLDNSYDRNTVTGRMTIVTKAIETIDRDKALTQRILSALKTGGSSALGTLINHPVASFLISALEDWQKSKKG